MSLFKYWKSFNKRARVGYWLGLIDRQKESEYASFAFLAFHPDPPAVQLHHCPGNGKPQAHAAIAAGEMCFHLEEAFKYTRQISDRDANPIIRHTDGGTAVILLHLHCYMSTDFCE